MMPHPERAFQDFHKSQDGKLILDASSEINITNLDEVYKFLLTPKSLRKKINKLNINFTYLFGEKIININISSWVQYLEFPLRDKTT